MVDEDVEAVSPRFNKDLVDSIDLEHKKQILDWKRNIVLNFLTMLVPMIIGEIEYYYCRFVLLPAGRIQLSHPSIGVYSPFTMLESEFLKIILETMTFFIGIMIFLKYYESKETSDYWTGEKFYSANKIGYVPTTAGLLAFGTKIYQKIFITPMKSYNYDGISFQTIDNIHNFQMSVVILNKDYMQDLKWKSEHQLITMTKSITVGEGGGQFDKEE